jgi:hypothetical protein
VYLAEVLPLSQLVALLVVLAPPVPAGTGGVSAAAGKRCSHHRPQADQRACSERAASEQCECSEGAVRVRVQCVRRRALPDTGRPSEQKRLDAAYPGRSSAQKRRPVARKACERCTQAASIEEPVKPCRNSTCGNRACRNWLVQAVQEQHLRRRRVQAER